MASKKRTHPKFLRPNYGRSSRKRIKSSWRRQRGIDNKKRAKIAYMGSSPSIGYGQPSDIHGFHPRGMPEKLVQSKIELQGVKNTLIRIASGVGRKKREEIIKAAESAGLRVLNKAKIYPPKKIKKAKESKVQPQKIEKAKIPA